MGASNRVSRSVACGVLAVVAGSTASHGQCLPTWSEGLHAAPFDAPTLAVVFDDGTGPALFVAARRNVWKLREGTWVPFGDTFYANGTNTAGVPVVRALAVFDDGTGPALYAGGTFRRSGLSGAPESMCANIAKWDGSAWVGIGDGSTTPSSITVGLTGTVATEFEGNLSGVWAMQEVDFDGAGPGTPRLIIAGAFTQAGDNFTSESITSWDGTQWVALGGVGANQPVQALGVFDFDGPGPEGQSVIIGGQFSFVKFTADTRRVARYDGTTWLAMGGETLPDPDTARPSNFVTLDRDGDGPLATELLCTCFGQILRLTESGWTAFEDFATSTSAANHRAGALAVDRAASGDTLYIGGELWDVSGNPAENLAKWSMAGGFESTGLPGVRAQPCTPSDSLIGNSVFQFLRVLDIDGAGPAPESVVFSGNFRSVGGEGASAIAEFVPSTATFGYPGRGAGTPFLNGGVGSGYVWDADGAGPGASELYVFSTGVIGSSQPGLVHKFNGSNWEHVGARCGPAMAQFTPYYGSVTSAMDGGEERLFAIGPSDLPLMWVLRGGAWELISDAGATGSVTVLSATGFDPDGAGPLPRELYVSRRWTLNDVDSFTEIVKYDGATWSMVSSSFVPIDCDAQLRVVQSPAGEELYVTGNFSEIDGVALSQGARRHGAVWEAYPGAEQLANSRVFPVYATVGGETRMYISFGGVRSWDGTDWQSVPGTFRRANNAIVTPTIFGVGGGVGGGMGGGAGLLAVGPFVSVDGQSAPGAALYDGVSWTALGALTTNVASPRGLLFDDGTGEALWIFGASSAQPASNGIAKLVGGTGCGCPPCAADYDGNGGVDGGDLAAFFADFEQGASCADVDQNGGVDGGDLGYFFSVFEAGGC